MKVNDRRKELFLVELRQAKSVSVACERIGISRRTAYQWRKQYADFATMWEDAVETGSDVLEDEARRRGMEGVAKPVYQGGELVGHVQEYSDTLLIFLLKSRRPEKFRDNHNVNLTGTITLEALVLEAASLRDAKVEPKVIEHNEP